MARFARAPSRPSAVLPRSASAPRGRSPLGVIVRARFAGAPRGRSPTGLFGFLPQLAGGVARSAEGARSVGPLGNSRVSHGSLRSRPLPAFGRTPPFRFRSTGEKSFGGHRPCPFRCRSTGEKSDWPLWISPPACWRSGTKCRGGAVRRTAGKLQGVSWLASLAPPPGLRPYSPVPLPLHGGDVRLASLDFSPSLLGEWHEVPRGRGPQDRWETPGCLLARFARAPSSSPAVLPRSAATPRGRSPLGSHRPCPFLCRSMGGES